MDNYKLLSIAKDLRKALKTIEDLLQGYEGVNGNSNYVFYCWKRADEAANEDGYLKSICDSAYNTDVSKRWINSEQVESLHIMIKTYFKLLDDIDTASDIFKPKWCKITSAVAELVNLRWLYCSVNGNIQYNGNCYTAKIKI